MASKTDPPQSNTVFMPVWLQGRFSKINTDSNDMNVYGSSPPGNSCLTDFVKPPSSGLVQRKSSPDLTKYESFSKSTLMPKSAQATPLTSPESSPNVQRKNRSGYLSDSECDMPSSRRGWMFSGLFSTSANSLLDPTRRIPLVQISEDNDDSTKPVTEAPKAVKKRRNKSTMSKFEINAFAPTSM